MGEATPDQIAHNFARTRTTSVQPLLESLAALGYATRADGGRFSSRTAPHHKPFAAVSVSSVFL